MNQGIRWKAGWGRFQRFEEKGVDPIVSSLGVRGMGSRGR